MDFPAEAIRNAGYHPSHRGMKGHNGVATLTLTPPEKVIYGLHEGPDNEYFRITQTVVSGIPIINSYVPQCYSISPEKYRLKLEWFRRLRTYFETALNPAEPSIWVGDLNVAPLSSRRPWRSGRRWPCPAPAPADESSSSPSITSWCDILQLMK